MALDIWDEDKQAKMLRIGIQSNSIYQASWGMKGFSISAEPSIGLTIVIVVPRQTTRPNWRTRGADSSTNG